MYSYIVNEVLAIVNATLRNILPIDIERFATPRRPTN